MEYLPRLENKPGGSLTSDGQAVVEYLHRRIAESQRAMACLYEYARHSEVLRRLTAFHRDRVGSKKSPEYDLGLWQIVENTLGVATPEPFAFDWLWQSLGDFFPERPWRDIPSERRPKQSVRLRPLPVLTTRMFADYGERARAENERSWQEYQSAVQAGIEPPKGGPPLALFREGENGERLVVAFHLELTKGKAALLRQFKAFLDGLPENKGVLREAARAASERSARPSDWLRDLALWRLHETLGTNKGAVRDWIVEHGTNLRTRKPMPMRDGRRSEGTHAAENREDSSLRAAAKRAERNLCRLLPFEALPDELATMKAESSARIGHLWEQHFGGEQASS